jgi:hypothetical protein
MIVSQKFKLSQEENPVPEKKSDPAGKERPTQKFETFASFSSKPHFIAFKTFSIKVFAIQYNQHVLL